MSAPARPKPPVYGLMAEFDTVGELVDAVKATRAAGYRQYDAYTPFPVEAVAEAMGEHTNRLPLLVLLGGIAGLVGGYALAYWTSAIDYPINVGGRPLPMARRSTLTSAPPSPPRRGGGRASRRSRSSAGSG